MVNTEGPEYIPKSLIHSWEYCPIGTCCFHQAGSLLLPQPQVKNRFITSSLGQERTCPELDHGTRLPLQIGAGLFSSRSALCVCSQHLLEEVATGSPLTPPLAQQELRLHQSLQVNVCFRGESLSWAKKEEFTPCVPKLRTWLSVGWEPGWGKRRERPPRLAGKTAPWSAPATGCAGHPWSLHKGTREPQRPQRWQDRARSTGHPDTMTWSLNPQGLILYFYSLVLLPATCLAVSALFPEHGCVTRTAEK